MTTSMDGTWVRYGGFQREPSTNKKATASAVASFPGGRGLSDRLHPARAARSLAPADGGHGARGGLTGVEETVTFETGDQRGARGEHAATGGAVDDHFLGKPIQQVDRGDAAVLE